MADDFETDLLDHTTKLSMADLARVVGVDITWIETLHAHGAISEQAGAGLFMLGNG